MWITALLALVKPILTRLLAALGMGVISYTGSELLISNFTADITANLNGLTPSLLQIASLFGVIESLSIMLGALTTSASLSIFKKLGFL